MKSVLRFGLAVLAVAMVAGLGYFRADDKDKPKFTIKEVMKKAHTAKTGLKDKAISDKGTKEEKAELVELYTALGQNKPPKGDEKVWKEKTDAILTAAKDVAEDKKDSVDALKKATDCKACHTLFKGK